MCKSKIFYVDLVFFASSIDHIGHVTLNGRTIEKLYLVTLHSTFPLKDLALLIEDKWMKRDEFATFISAIEKIISPKEKNLALQQGNNFIDVYKTFFDKHYA